MNELLTAQPQAVTEPAPAQSTEPITTPATTQEPVTEPVTPPNEPFLTVKHFDEQRPLTKEETIALAQKGIDYDRVRPLYDNTQNFLKNTGFSSTEEAETFIKEQKQQSLLNQKQNRVGELEGLGYDTETAAKMVDTEIENSTLKSQLSEYRQKELQGKEDQKLAVEIGEFQKSFKDVDINALPAEVLLKTNAGMPLKTAYMEYAYAQVQKENDALKANNENAQATSGALGGNEPPESDIYTQDQYDNLTREDYKKNPTKADKSMAYYSKK